MFGTESCRQHKQFGKKTAGGLTTEGRLKRSGGTMKHGEFIIIPFEHTELNVRPVGTDVMVTPIK